MPSRRLLAALALALATGCAPAANAPTPPAGSASPTAAPTQAPTTAPTAPAASPSTVPTSAATPKAGYARTSVKEGSRVLTVDGMLSVQKAGSGIAYTVGKAPGTFATGEASVQLNLTPAGTGYTYQLNVLIDGTKGLTATGTTDATTLTSTGGMYRFSYKGKLQTSSKTATAEEYEISIEDLPTTAP
jgi:hypothetical protein